MRWLDRLDDLDERRAWAVGVGLGAAGVAAGAVAEAVVPALSGVGVMGAAAVVGVVGWWGTRGDGRLEAPTSEPEPVSPPAQEPPPTPKEPPAPWAEWWGNVAPPVSPGSVPLPNDLRAAARPVMVWVGGGEFWMGSREDDPRAYADEKPRHHVRLSPLAVAATTVTRRQWREVMGREAPGQEAGDLPVTNIDWWAAITWCNRLSALEGLAPCYVVTGEGDTRSATWLRQANGYRLPTEAEWEFLARAGTDTAWSFGDDEAAVDEHAWFSRNAGGHVHPVAGRRANPWGLYDVHGNVWEWCADWHAYREAAAALPDPMEGRPLAPKVAAGGILTRVNNDVDTGVVDNVGDGLEWASGLRALRGGAFCYVPRNLRSANRLRGVPAGRDWLVGFRCVRGVARQLDP